MSKVGHDILTRSYKVASGQTSITGWQVVEKATNDDEIQLWSDDANYPLGVVIRDSTTAASAGDVLPVRFSGIVKVRAGAAISAGALVGILGTAGYVDDITAGTEGDYYLGLALEDATAVGDEILIFIDRHRRTAS